MRRKFQKRLEFRSENSEASITVARFHKKDFNLIVSGDDQNEVKVWRVGTNNPIASMNPIVQGQSNTNYSTSVMFNTDASYVVSGTHRGTIYAWDSCTSKLIANLKGHNNSVQCISEIENEPQ